MQAEKDLKGHSWEESSVCHFLFLSYNYMETYDFFLENIMYAVDRELLVWRS